MDYEEVFIFEIVCKLADSSTLIIGWLIEMQENIYNHRIGNGKILTS